MEKRTARIKLKLDKSAILALNTQARRFGISRNEYINRAVFTSLYHWSNLIPIKDQIEVLRAIIGKDSDKDYYRTRVEAMVRLKHLLEKS
jgi:hypothetical protein